MWCNKLWLFYHVCVCASAKCCAIIPVLMVLIASYEYLSPYLTTPSIMRHIRNNFSLNTILAYNSKWFTTCSCLKYVLDFETAYQINFTELLWKSFFVENNYYLYFQCPLLFQLKFRFKRSQQWNYVQDSSVLKRRFGGS